MIPLNKGLQKRYIIWVLGDNIFDEFFWKTFSTPYSNVLHCQVHI